MTADEMKELVRRVGAGVRVTKVVATRSFKSQTHGDFFSGFTAAWNTVQDDTGLAVEDADVASNGLTLNEARVAHLMVAMQADLAAYDAAFANGALSRERLVEAREAVRRNYNLLISECLTRPEKTP